MKKISHLNERAIELMVLGSQSIADRREEYQRHLDACRYCRELYDEVREYYTALEEAGGDRRPRVLETSSLAIQPRYEGDALSVSAPPRGVIRRWVKRNPKTSVAGGAALLFGALGWIWTSMTSSGGSPAYVNYNVVQNFVEVYNARHEMLWQVAVVNAASMRDAATLDHSASRVTVTDLDGDGLKEVLVLAQSTDPDLSHLQRLAYFDGSGRLKALAGDLPPAEYLGVRYPEAFNVNSFNVLPAQADRQAEVVAVATNGRSPCVIIRYDAQGNTMGEYWHFGNVAGPYLYDIDDDGRSEVLFSGSNDMDEAKEGSPGVRAVVFALDPKRIVGRTESSITSGFGFPKSEAERYYLRVPRGRLDSLLGAGLRVGYHGATDSSRLVFAVSTFPGELRIMFDLVFNRSLEVTAVRSTSDTEMTIGELRRRGQISGLPYSMSILEDYRRIEYWDGTEWKKGRVGVQAPVRQDAPEGGGVLK